VILGDGKRLFGSLPDKQRLRLTESRTVGGGVNLLKYERAAS